MKRLPMILRILGIVAILIGGISTANAIPITLNSYNVPNWPYGSASTVTLKIFANQDFLTSDGQLIKAGNAAQGTGWYRSVVCSVSGTTVTIPSITNFPTTTDSQTLPTATFTARFYTGTLARDYFQTNFQVKHTFGTPQSFDVIYSYNHPQGAPPDRTYPTFDQMGAAINSAVSTVADASLTVKGRTKLSVDPASPTNPIAVGDNDTRIPTASQAAAFAGTSGTPSGANKYVTDADARNTNTRTPTDASVTTAKLAQPTGNGANIPTSTGALSSGHCVQIDAFGNLVDAGIVCGGGGGGGGGLPDPGVNGVLIRTGANATAARTLAGTTNQISIANADGTGGAPTFSIPGSAQLSIAKLTNLGTNGFVKTSGSDGSLSVAGIVASDLPGSFAGFANPSGLVGLSAVNGSAATAMRSDGAPAIDQGIAPTWTGIHTFQGVPAFAPTSGTAPFTLSSNGQGQTVVGLKADQLNKTITAGNGLSGGGALTTGVTVTLGTPSTLTVLTTNSSSGTTHTHTISSSSNPGGTQSLLATDTLGYLQLVRLGIGTAPTQPLEVGGNVFINSSTANLYLKDTSTGFQSSSSTVITPQSNNALRSTSYTSGLIGWNVSAGGNAEFNNIDVRGAVHSSVFVFNELQATAGTLGVFKSACKLRTDAVVPASPTYGTTTINIDCVDQDGVSHAASQLFATSDVLRLKDGLTGDTWFTVFSTSDQTTFWRYVATIQAGSNNVTYRTGAGVADYGASGAGFIIQTADATNSPYLQMATHAATFSSGDSSGSLTVTPQLRLGNLNGSYGYASDVYGLGAGQYGATSKSWVTVEQTNGFRVGNNTTTLAQWFTNGNILIGQTGASQDNVLISSGAISIRNNTTERIGITAAGSMTIKDSAGNAVLTFDASQGAEITKKLTMPGSSSAIAIGTTPPTSASAGTGIWEDRTGIYGLNANTVNFKLDATNGNITAIAGAIGGFTIGSAALTAGSGSTTVAMDSGGTNPAFYAGSATPGSAPFRVTNAGALTATNATITGAITASSGSITGPLTMSGSSSSICLGTACPTSATAGTGGWLDRTGLYGLSSNVQQAIFNFSTGAITAGAGNVVLNSNGISIATGTSQVNKLTWTNGGSPLSYVYTNYSSGSTFLGLQSLITDNTASSYVLFDALNETGYGVELLMQTRGASAASQAGKGTVTLYGTNTNMFTGFLIEAGGFPAVSAPGTALHVGTTDSATTAITDILTVRHSSSTGVLAAGGGVGVRFALDSSTTINRDAARIGALWTTATDASRTSAVVIQAVNNAGALAEVARFAGNGDASFTGKVGIGQAADSSVYLSILTSAAQFPATGFQVRASTHATSRRASFVLGADSGSTIGWSFGQDSAGDGTKDLYIYDVATAAFRLKIGTSGGVLVGAPTGGDKGAGSINAETVWRNGTSLDSVFEPGYKPLSIDEMGEYLTLNHHLPTIPTNEVNVAGSTNMGALTDRLWETTENHALYILQLNDRIKQLEARINDLEKRRN